jgi:uncharacterized protein (TIGR03118 family)
MQKMMLKNYIPFLTKTPFVLFVLLLVFPACRKPHHQLKGFEQVNLVANKASYGASRVDPQFVNGWGIAFGPSGPAWVSANGTGFSFIFNSLGAEVRPAVTIPSPEALTGGQPTGAVFNASTTDFKLTNGNAARFIFAGTDGVISGWNTGNAAELVLNDAPAAVYTGLAIASDGIANFIYAANFKERKIDVYDKNWTEVDKPFTDPAIPAGYSPFNIQNIGGKLYVMYAKVAPDGDEEVGSGNGYVDIYNPDGSLVKRFASRGALNAPWGVAQASASFWEDNDNDEDDNMNKNADNKMDKHCTSATVILVGNFGNGHISAYSQEGIFLGELHKHSRPIAIEGLWGISFAPATATTVNPNWLFFAAGPAGEQDGLFGYIAKQD